MIIPLTPVDSSQIHAVGYDGPSQTLAIQFKGGASSRSPIGSLYHYQNVPTDVHSGLVSAESIGSYFGKNIKPFTDKYPFQKQ